MANSTGLAEPKAADQRPLGRSVGALSAVGLAFVAGFADAVAYLHWHAFGANMTGNTVLFGIALYRDPPSALVPLTPIVAFFSGSIVARMLLLRFSPVVPLLVEAAVLAAADFGNSYATQLGGIAVAMGIQNLSVSEFSGIQANTSFVTGNYNKLGQALVDLFVPAYRGAALLTLTVLAPLIAGYAAGAVAGAVSELHAGRALLIVTPLVLLIAYGVHRTRSG